MNILREFFDIAGDPAGYAEKWKVEHDGAVVGYLCSYTPEEIIVAAGALPFRILGSGRTISLADSHLQSYSCSLIRGALEDALTGRLNFLSGTIFPHTCDSIQRLSDIWRLNTGYKFHIDLVMPVKLQTKSAAVYMQSVIDRFKNELAAALNVNISEKNLRQAVYTCNRIRQNLRKLYNIQKTAPDRLNSIELHTVLMAAMVMDRNELDKKLTTLTKAVGLPDADVKSSGKKILLGGSVCTRPEIYRVIEDAGGSIVGDDFCTGARNIHLDVDTTGDMIEAVSRRYMTRSVCPAKHSGLQSRGEHLVSMAGESDAKGVILVYLKFCDPHLFDYPYIKAMLDKENIPCMLYEIEEGPWSGGQFQTRCEAFMELI